MGSTKRQRSFILEDLGPNVRLLPSRDLPDSYERPVPGGPELDMKITVNVIISVSELGIVS